MAEKDDPKGAAAAAPTLEATAAVAESPPGKSRRRCPLCNSELIDHGYDNPHKAGAHHCSNPECGACWASGMRELREGHPGPKMPETVEAP